MSAPYILPDCSTRPLSLNPICDITASPAVRAQGLVGALSPEEKVENLVSHALGSEEVGIPPYGWWNEALHGLADSPGTSFADSPPWDTATSFPMPLLMASAFDDDLIRQVGDIIGTEARAWSNSGWAGGVDYWTPNVNPFKDPRWGRGSETPGEDALQVSRYARAMVKGLEGDKEERRIVATCKHYVGNDFEAWGNATRHNFDAQINEQDLAEYYARPFQECARDCNVGSIMCAYNSVNGQPSCANSYLQQTLLREHWGWTEHNNYIVSDCGAVQDIWEHHNYTETNAEGAAVAFEGGCDLSCEYETTSDVADAYEEGLLTEEMMDRALLRLYEGLVRTGFFDGNSSDWASLGWNDVNTAHARKVAYQSAVEGIVLLKNDGVLPIEPKDNDAIAMIGFWAEDETKLQGGYSGHAPFLHSPVYAAKERGFEVHPAWGPTLQNHSSSDNWTANALNAAKKSDYILYFGGLDVTAAAEDVDRLDLDWPVSQLDLLDELSTLGKPLVVVQMGDQLDNTPLLDNDAIGGIVWANYPGQDGGPAVLDIITGDQSPAGRLCVTQYPSNYTEIVPMTDMGLRPTDDFPGRTYRWYSTPIAPFGFGLHYTTFDANFSNVALEYDIQNLLDGCDTKYPDTCSVPPIKVEISNTGDRTSDFATLVFLKGDNGPEPYPLKTLATYARAKGVPSGGSQELQLEWTLDSLARRELNGDLVLNPGSYTLLLDEPTQATAELTLTGEKVTLDKWPQVPRSDE